MINNPTVSLQVNTVYFTSIASGKKTVEGRLNKPPISSIKVNETIRFLDVFDHKRHVDVKAIRLQAYSSFHEMLEKEGLENCLPGITDLNEGVKIYHDFPSYKENEKQLGVLAIGIQLLHN